MTTTLFHYFMRKNTGNNLRKLYQSPVLFLIAASGLYGAEIKVAVAPFVIYLMTTFLMLSMTMLSLSSTENSADLKNMFMMPLGRGAFLVSYLASISIHVFLIRVFGLLAMIIAVSRPEPGVILRMAACIPFGALLGICVFAFRARPYFGCLLIAAAGAALWFLHGRILFLPAVFGIMILCMIALHFADVFAFYVAEGSSKRGVSSHRRHGVFRYLLRYLLLHKNYLVNSAVMIVCACVFPVFFAQNHLESAYPVGFAIVLMNTPLCILLSCSPQTEQAVRILPGQMRAFCIPYCLFLFLSNLIPSALYATFCIIFLGVSPLTAYPAALFFSLHGAIISVALEWFTPIRDWKTETDLWHHPRKYVMPACMALLSSVLAMIPEAVYVLLGLLALEISVLLVSNHFASSSFKA